MAKRSTFEFVLFTLFVSIILLQSFIPFLGNIPLVILDITIIHITVIVGGIVMGPKYGAGLGLAWGTCSMIRAFTTGSAISKLVFTNPIIAIVPRVLVGFIAAYVYLVIARKNKASKIAMAISGVIGSLVNTILVLGLIYLLIGPAYAEGMGTSINALPKFLMTIIVTNGIPEAIASGIIVPVIASVLIPMYQKKTTR
ncbi:Uncharacterized membrane protein [Granulicatella balaenopterae]|uniref:Uncharacterized membrane protein n=1 Tax=Granulicatella balaenopterae TaxID=137733 RepID=A0A1H9KLI5_9LACT|nr:ECF transporter S component [Granulicatella balaenopterae]SEQ99785.1 Uncharacterized membrane protein [Granulicatella balaenopterae]